MSLAIWVLTVCVALFVMLTTALATTPTPHPPIHKIGLMTSFSDGIYRTILAVLEILGKRSVSDHEIFDNVFGVSLGRIITVQVAST